MTGAPLVCAVDDERSAVPLACGIEEPIHRLALALPTQQVQPLDLLIPRSSQCPMAGCDWGRESGKSRVTVTLGLMVVR